MRENDAGSCTDKGVAFFESGKIEAAIQCFDKALEINPKYSPALT